MDRIGQCDHDHPIPDMDLGVPLWHEDRVATNHTADDHVVWEVDVSQRPSGDLRFFANLDLQGLRIAVLEGHHRVDSTAPNKAKDLIRRRETRRHGCVDPDAGQEPNEVEPMETSHGSLDAQRLGDQAAQDVDLVPAG